MTPCNDHSATTVSSAVIAEITMVVGLTPLIMLANQDVRCLLSSPIGRVSLTLVNFIRVGSCQIIALLPPSSRCSMTISQPSPSQLLNIPSGNSSILTLKQTLTAGSFMSAIGFLLVLHSFSVLLSLVVPVMVRSRSGRAGRVSGAGR